MSDWTLMHLEENIYMLLCALIQNQGNILFSTNVIITYISKKLGTNFILQSLINGYDTNKITENHLLHQQKEHTSFLRQKRILGSESSTRWLIGASVRAPTWVQGPKFLHPHCLRVQEVSPPLKLH